MIPKAPKQDVYIGNNIDVLRQMPAESVDVVVTSPPYWALRDYKSPPQIYGGDKDCQHVWEEHTEPARGGVGESANVGANKDGEGNNRGHPTVSCYCTKCGAWKGQLGLEPSPLEYIDHLVAVFDEVKRVLKPTGACWVNLGDTYSTVSGDMFRSKSLVQIPSRFAIAMTDRGWILRNETIWQKPNVMPTSTKDRFTVDFEKFFFFTKNERYYFEQQYEPLKEESIARAKRAKHNTLDAHDRVAGTNAIEMQHDDPNWQRFANPNGRNKRAVWPIPTRGEHYNHVAMFPKTLIETPIKACCPPGGVVIDIFAGSGTVLSYCKENGIDSIGIEVNPAYEGIISGRVRKSNFIPKLDSWGDDMGSEEE